MDGKGDKKIKKYLKIYPIFIICFSIFMFILAAYEISVNQQQMLKLIVKHPDMEAEIIAIWKGAQQEQLFLGNSSMEEGIRIIEDKYGYKFHHSEVGNTLWMFWGTGLIAGMLLIFVLSYMDWKKGQKRENIKEQHKELYECLQRFRNGEFDYVPEDTGESEEWMKICESLRELGLYFAGLKEQLQEEENSTKALITDISHQLKTPLASLRMSYELVVGSQLSEEEKKEFQKQEEKEIEKLELLLNELVNLSRLETNMIQIKPVMASFKKTITAAVSQVYIKARNKNMEMQVELEGDIVIRHDAKWTEEAIANVLDNAVKYSEADTTISVRVLTLVSNVLVEIEDEGMGIPSEELSNIYKRFYRGSEARQKIKEGSGVGLYLARMILECQGGTISAKRKIDSGTVFKITLPL